MLELKGRSGIQPVAGSGVFVSGTTGVDGELDSVFAAASFVPKVGEGSGSLPGKGSWFAIVAILALLDSGCFCASPVDGWGHAVDLRGSAGPFGDQFVENACSHCAANVLSWFACPPWEAKPA